jgi:hypothetical protein
MYYFYFYQFATTCSQSCQRDLLSDITFAPLKNIFLLSICYPLKRWCIYVGSWYKIEGQFLIKRNTYHISNCRTFGYSSLDVTFIMHALQVHCTCQMQARNDCNFRKSSISPASCKQIDSSPTIKMLENCYVCFYRFINVIISYLLFFHNEYILI